MRTDVHIRRFVHPESVKPLRFRHRVEKKFGQLGIERIVSDNQLHATTVHHRNFQGSMVELARTMQTQPDSSDEALRAETLDAGAFGYQPITRSTWFAIALQNPHLEKERQHYADELALPYQGTFVPHVTLFKANTVSPDAIAEVGEWIRENVPEEITLKPIGVAWHVKDEASSSKSLVSSVNMVQ